MASSSMEVPSNREGLPRHEPQPQLEFPANLDILRSIAVLLVLLDHGLDMVGAKHNLEASLRDFDTCVGRLGVLLFFVHTNLVLNFSLARLRTSGWTLFRNFLVRRAFRLYPLSILCVLLVAIFKLPSTPLSHVAVQYNWVSLISNLALTSDVTNTPVLLGPLWTLSVEMEMYVVMPIVFMALGPLRSPRVALGLWLLAACFAWIQPAMAERLMAIEFAPCFLAGTVAYTLSGWYARRLPSLLWIPFLLALLCGFVITLQAAPEGISNMPLEWVFCLTLGLCIPLFHDSSLWIVNYAAKRIARYSYGIYLFHFIALWVGFTALSDLPEPWQWAVTLALLVVMSVGAYHLLEKPAIDLGTRLTGPRARANASVGQIA